MPTLDWIGKKKVINHHLEVPFRVLEKKYTYSADNKASASQNKILHGDNLEALKALLPEYEGKIDCIYIDPPYNTGNEGWVYNDNVNDPRIKKWLGEVVGKESEDFTRHDKWLCMMYPRLKLLQKLLSEKGAIFISIDDNEEANLKLICDEIFGSGNFVANVSWQRTYSIRNDAKSFMNEVEHIIVYSKNPNWIPNRLARDSETDKSYKNPDNDKEKWASVSALAPGAATHQGMVYAIQNPFTGEMMYPVNGRCWTFGQNQMLEIMQEWTKYELKDINDENKRAEICGVSENEIKKDIKAIVIAKEFNEANKDAIKVLERGQWPKLFFTQGGKGTLRRKTYLSAVGGNPPSNLFQYKDTGHTDEAKKEILSIFEGNAIFDTPKPTRLIERILQIATDKDSIILDSFAGSGTTAHAVLNMNRKDGGNRSFILIEMMDYAESITAERVKRVIKGYSDVEGTGGDFSFYELGEPLLINNLLNENIETPVIREYIYFTETGKKMVVSTGSTTASTQSENQYFLGCNYGAAYWFYYEKDHATTLDIQFLQTIKNKYEQYIIYADICLLPKELLQKNNITFKKIPRDIKRF